MMKNNVQNDVYGYQYDKNMRSCLLVSASLSRSICQFSAAISALAGGASGTLLSRSMLPRVWASIINLIPVAGTFRLLSFQGVCPVSPSISWRIALKSCVLNAGSLNGFLTGLDWAGGIPPLPLFPLPPLPGCCPHLGSMVAGNLHLPEATPQYINVDLTIGQSFGVDNTWCFPQGRLSRLVFLWTGYELKVLLDVWQV